MDVTLELRTQRAFSELSPAMSSLSVATSADTSARSPRRDCSSDCTARRNRGATAARWTIGSAGQLADAPQTGWSASAPTSLCALPGVQMKSEKWESHDGKCKSVFDSEPQRENGGCLESKRREHFQSRKNSFLGPKIDFAPAPLVGDPLVAKFREEMSCKKLKMRRSRLVEPPRPV